MLFGHGSSGYSPRDPFRHCGPGVMLGSDGSGVSTGSGGDTDATGGGGGKSKEDVQAARLKKFAVAAAAAASPPTVAPRVPSRAAAPALAGPPLPPTAKEQEVARLKREKREVGWERQRLRMEIQRDREARGRNGGVLPAAHDALFAKHGSEVYAAVEAAAAASAVPRGPAAYASAPTAVDGEKALERVASALSTIAGAAAGKPPREAQVALALLNKILQNIMDNPNEHKYRSINMKGKAFQEKLNPVVGMRTLLHALGFRKVSSTNEQGIKTDCLVVDEPDMNLFQESSTNIFLRLEQK